MNEAQFHEDNSFLTLTYDDDHLPKDGSLHVKHWQDFVKRARKTTKFRYFHCGEYGEVTTPTTPLGRPHYHACIFGTAWLNDRKFWKLAKNGKDRLYTSEKLSKLWPEGIHAIGDLTFESAAYTARYIMKKTTGIESSFKKYGQKLDINTGEITYRFKPEYTTMSRRPGVGSNWINKFLADVYPSDEVIVRGQQCRPPKFYDQALEKADPLLYKKIKVQRAKRALDQSDENTYTRLATRETVQLAKIRHFSRDLT